MNISPILMLIIGLVAAALFLVLFTIASFITVRNRRIIRKHASDFGSREQSHPGSR